MSNVTADYDFSRLSERIRFIVNNWRGGLQSMAEHCSMSDKRLKELANGKRKPTDRELKAIAKHRCVNKTWFLTGQGRMTGPEELSAAVYFPSPTERQKIVSTQAVCGKGTGKSAAPYVAPELAGAVGRINDVWETVWHENTRRMAEECQIDQELIEKVLAGQAIRSETEDVLQAIAVWTKDPEALDWLTDGKGAKPGALGGVIIKPGVPKSHAEKLRELMAEMESDVLDRERLEQLQSAVAELATRMTALDTRIDGLPATMAQELMEGVRKQVNGFSASWLARFTDQDHAIENLRADYTRLEGVTNARMAEMINRANQKLDAIEDLHQRVLSMQSAAVPDQLITEEAIEEVVQRILSRARVSVTFADVLETVPMMLRVPPLAHAEQTVVGTTWEGSKSAPALTEAVTKINEVMADDFVPVARWWTLGARQTAIAQQNAEIKRALSQMLYFLRDALPVTTDAFGNTLRRVSDLKLITEWLHDRYEQQAATPVVELRAFLADRGLISESQLSGEALVDIPEWLSYMSAAERERFPFGVVSPMGKRIRIARRELGLPQVPKKKHFVADLRCYRDWLFQLSSGDGHKADEFIAYWRQHHPSDMSEVAS